MPELRSLVSNKHCLLPSDNARQARLPSSDYWVQAREILNNLVESVRKAFRTSRASMLEVLLRSYSSN